MDRKLGDILGRFDAPPGLLLPRVDLGDVVVSKLNVIGERQRFGLRVLEAGFNVLFADLDAIFLRSPAPILADGDLIGERIWGRPLSVVKKWGAAICTGFYFVRSTPQTIKIFRRTHFMIATKRQRMPKWQASSTCRVAYNWHQSYGSSSSLTDLSPDRAPSSSTAPHGRRRQTVERCAAQSAWRRQLTAEVLLPIVQTNKWRVWQQLLQTAYALHCFPPHSMPCPGLKHGEKGCDKSVIMGSKVHIHGEVVFDKQQGLWFMKDEWEAALEKPSTNNFMSWLQSQYNGLRPGQSKPAAASS
ncbi:MAG: hypothetical protein SGPRY_002128 [Prymnesium sp.]